MKRPFLLAGLLGIIAMMLAVLTSMQIPRNHSFNCPEPFRRPVLALEFVRSAESLSALFGTDKYGRAGNIRRIRKAQNTDNFFIAGYTLFLLAFAMTIWRQTRKWRYALLVLLALAIGLSDLFENGAIRLLVDGMEKTPLQLESIDFQRLHFWAWAKWLGLAVFFAAIGPYVWSLRWLGRVLAAAGLLSALLGVFAWFSDAWIERYASAVFATFPLAVIFCFWYRAGRSG
ncbi:MAG: hypothetical protein IPH12_08185 [Saprospirales bacterium]|jgi:hypothetical protein|nr:hypothetical protein [Saprospirales bacterium]MBK8920808.1 hypothetical protein [Saprospirales bacterium]